ncbi:hypothetical protein XH86_37705 (plasmid) [Bradyrhizobium guangdongense]|uniref:Transposase DDE domain-containing protein n=1 Tax=Bradyrhizobium guangdongense TaxID=1325090 RepID=A0A7S7VD69_9BRAD|nr:hypothetical protein XH86_37705 [Bradyrhizobium guangdongense]
MKPRGVAWNGAGGWLIFSQSRQVNFSRTVSMTLNRRGISQRLGHILAQCCNKPFLLILRPPAPPLGRCDHLRPSKSA